MFAESTTLLQQPSSGGSTSQAMPQPVGSHTSQSHLQVRPIVELDSQSQLQIDSLVVSTTPLQQPSSGGSSSQAMPQPVGSHIGQPQLLVGPIVELLSQSQLQIDSCVESTTPLQQPMSGGPTPQAPPQPVEPQPQSRHCRWRRSQSQPQLHSSGEPFNVPSRRAPTQQEQGECSDLLCLYGQLIGEAETVCAACAAHQCPAIALACCGAMRALHRDITIGGATRDILCSLIQAVKGVASNDMLAHLSEVPRAMREIESIRCRRHSEQRECVGEPWCIRS